VRQLPTDCVLLHRRCELPLRRLNHLLFDTAPSRDTRLLSHDRTRRSIEPAFFAQSLFSPLSQHFEYRREAAAPRSVDAISSLSTDQAIATTLLLRSKATLFYREKEEEEEKALIGQTDISG